jgi:hypothetical protein
VLVAALACWLQQQRAGCTTSMLAKESACWLQQQRTEYSSIVLAAAGCWLQQQRAGFSSSMLETAAACWLQQQHAGSIMIFDKSSHHKLLRLWTQNL